MLTELPHSIGAVVLFGLDGSFVATAYGYPTGAQWRWWELDNDGTVIRQFEWRWQGGMLQSPGGSKVVYGDVMDAVSGNTRLLVRDMSGSGRVLAPIHGAPVGWLDADRVLVEAFDQPGVIHAIDTVTGTDQIVFSPPAPPTIKADGDTDWFRLSGDLRWAIFVRWSASGSLLRQDLFDVTRQTYVPGVTLGANDISVAPVGDVALWLEGTQVRAMHLCDRRVVTIGSVTSSGQLVTTRWSPDGRFAAFSFGVTDEQTGPERLVIVDLHQGAIAEVDRPWGFIRQWSPDGRHVVLSRSGFHGPASKLARFEFR